MPIGEETVKPERRCQSEGRLCPQGRNRQSSSGSGQKLKKTTKTPSVCWNKDACIWWLGPKNVGQVLINGKLVTSLIDNGTRMKVVTPSFVKRKGLGVGPILDLNKHKGCILVSTSGGFYTEPLGYVIIWIQIPRIPSYDEDQVALVIRDLSEFGRRVQVIIGMPTICNMVCFRPSAMKKSQMQYFNIKIVYSFGIYSRIGN